MAKLLNYRVLKNVFDKSAICSLRYCSISSSSNGNKPHFDIIIAGGGLVGLALAASLAKNAALAEKNILLLEGAPPYKPASRDKYSNRVSAINRQSINLLRSVGAWEHVESVRCKPVKQMQVWDAISGELIEFSHPNFSDSVACIVENDLILEGLHKQLNTIENVCIKNSSSLISCELVKDGFDRNNVILKTGEKITCDLLIGADGVNSIVRKNMCVDNFSLNYKQFGVVATLDLNADEAEGNTVAWQRFLPSGPVALLPLSDSQCSLVWSTSIEHAKELLKMTPDDFVLALNESFIKQYPSNQFVTNILNTVDNLLANRSKIQQLPPIITKVQENSRAAFPLGFGHASSYICNGAVLIGDAAHRIHPLAGQGVNLGFGDVVKLTEVLSSAIYSGSELGNLNYLLEYERERLKANIPIMLGVHTIQQLYCNNFAPFVLMRSLGTKITNSARPIKNFLMEKAMS